MSKMELLDYCQGIGYIFIDIAIAGPNAQPMHIHNPLLPLSPHVCRSLVKNELKGHKHLGMKGVH
jgi:hypothetical protein